MKRYLSILLTIVMLFTSLPLNVFADTPIIETGVTIGDDILVDEDGDITEQETDEGIQEDTVDNTVVDIDTSQPSVLPTENDLLTDNSTTELSPEMLDILENITVDNDEDVIETIPVEKEEQENDAITEERPQREENGPSRDEILAIQMMEEELRELNSGIQENSVSYSMVEEQPVALFSMSAPNAVLADSERVEETEVDDEVIAEEETEVSETTESNITTESVTEDDEGITDEISTESDEFNNQEGSNETVFEENSIENSEEENSVKTDSSVSSVDEVGSETETTDEGDNTTLEDVFGVENDVLEEELIEESVQLFSNTYAGINGTIRLPEGVSASAGDMIRVYVYDAPVVENGRVVSEGGSSSILYKTINLAEGQTSGNFVIDELPDGEYEISVRYLTGNKNISGAMLYYTNNGLTENEYLTDAIIISNGRTSEYLDVVLPRSEVYISGTIDLENCIPTQDTYIGINTYNESNVNSSYQYAYKYVEAGTQYVEFEIGVKKGSYYANISSDIFTSGYYSNGALNSTYNQRTIINANEPVSGLYITIPESTSVVTTQYDITINFAEPEDCDKEYYMTICGADGDSISGKWIRTKKGDTSISTTFSPKGVSEVAYIQYKDITGIDSVYSASSSTSYFYSETLGITNNILEATNIVGSSNIVIQEPSYINISGDIITSGDTENIYEYTYVAAEFGTEIYYDRVYIKNGEYSIRVPDRYEGSEFKVFSAKGTYGDIIDSTKKYAEGSYVLSSGLETIPVNAGTYKNVSGIIALPVAAPTDGANVTIGYSYNTDNINVAQYVVEPGNSFVDYSVDIPDSENIESIYANLETFENVDIAPSATINDISTNTDISFDETTLLYGTVSLPDGITYDSDITFQVNASGEYDYYYQYASILAGQTSTTYALNVCKNEVINYISVSIQTSETELFEETYYISEGQYSHEYENIELIISENTEANFILTEAKRIRGTVSLPQGTEYNGARIRYWVYCVGEDSNVSYSNSMSYSTYDPYYENPFSVPVPMDITENYYIYVRVTTNGGNNISTNSYYYVADYQMTTQRSKATPVDGSSTYKLYFPTGNALTGTISFEEGCYVDGEFSCNIYAVNLDTNTSYNTYVSNLYNTDSFSYRLIVPSSERGYKVYASVYTYGGSVSNISESNYYSTAGTTANEDHATAIIVDGLTENINIEIKKARTISGEIIVPEDYKSLNDLQQVELYMDCDSGSSYWLNATVDENMNYEAPIPAEASGEYTLRMSFYDDCHNNIVKKNYYYDDENGNVISLDIDGTTSINNIDFEVEIGYAVSGTVSLPEDIQISNAEINVEVSDGNGNGCSISDLSLDTPSKPYMFAVPKNNDAAAITLSYIPNNSRVSSGLDYSSNVYIGTQYYVENSSLSINSDEATVLTLTEDMEDVDVTLLTGVVVNVTLVRPEVEKEYISGYVYIQDKDEVIDLSQRFTIQENKNEGKVTLTVPNSYIGEEIYLSYYTYSGNYLYNGDVYVNPDGTYSRTLEKAQTHTIGSTNDLRFTLAKIEDVQEVVRFKINFEEGSFTNDELYCQAYAYNVNTGRNYYTYCYFDTIQEFEVMIPVNEEDGDYRISAYISNYSDASTNVSEDKRYYYSTSGTTSSESEATTIKSTDTNISITIPKLEVITVNVGFEEGCFLTEDLYCNVQAYDINNYRSYYKSFYFDEIKDYEVVIPVQDKDSQYRVYVYINDYSDEPTNVSTGEYYYYSTDGTTTEEYYATPVTVTDENISITIPKLRSISGSIIVDDDYQCLDELTEVSAYLSRTSGSGRSYYYTTARVDEDMNYQFFIPEDIIGDYKIGLEFESDYRNNIIKDEYFYYTNGSGSIQSISITGNSDITDIDIKAQTGYAVTGTIKLPDDFVAGGDYDSVQYYISLYNGMYVTLSEEEPEAEFMFAVPKSGGTYRLSANAYNYFGNLYTGEVYYKTSTDVAYDYSDATSIPVNSNLSGLVLTIPTGIKFDVNVELPETYYNSLEMCFRVKSDDGEFENSNTIYAYNDEDNYCGFVLPNYMLGEKVYLTYEIDDYYNELSDTFYTALVYVNPDGTYAGAKKLAKLIQLGETNEFVVTPVSNEAVLMPEYVLESEHPYANEIEETYTYTHPETVDFLAIKFSEETDINDDYLYLYDENDNLLDTYNYEDLSNRTINVPGSSFKLKLTSDYSGTGFGFAIESITGSNFVLESNHPYESNMDTYYYYTYPESVEELDITFSDNTEFDDYNDYLYIYEGDSDYYYNSYSSNSLKGRTIRIYGNSFKLRLVSDGSDERYGFSIISINPVVYYTVTFKNYDGNVLATQKVEAGDDAYYYGSNPHKEMDENYMYVFKGWDIDLENVSSDLIATAQFEAKTYHTVTFKNYDGSHLDTQYVATGTTAYYNGYTPTKPSEGTTSYRFIGWDVVLSNVTSDLIATAQFEELVIYLESEHPYANSMNKTYTYTHPEPADELKITFSADTYTESGYDYIYILDENGSQIGGRYSGSQLANATITVPGNKFSIRLTSDGSATKYGFAIIKVEATQVQRHTVTFKNYNGDVLDTQSVVHGYSAVYNGETPTRPKEGNTSYTFTGWDVDLSYITEDVIATAVYTSKTVYLESAHPYANNIDETYTYEHPEVTEGLRITFSNETRTESGCDIIYLYDGADNLIGSYSGNQLAGMSFVIEGETFKVRLKTDYSVTYHGFEVVDIEAVDIVKHTVTFQNYDGTVLQMKTVISGNDVLYTGTYPTREMDEDYVYIFNGWDGNLTNIVEDTVLTAQFIAKTYHTVTFKNYDGEILSEQIVPTGDSAYFDYSKYPTKERDENYMYEFNGWDISLNNITSDCIATAQFNAIPYHTVTYKNYDGTILYTHDVRNGGYSYYNGVVPYKPYSGNIGYVFAGWDANLNNVTDDIETVALFNETEIITISTEQEFRNISGNSEVYVLDDDIYLTEKLPPISMNRSVFDGRGHRINNVKFDETVVGSVYGRGAFGNVYNSVICDVAFDVDATVDEGAYYYNITGLAHTISGSTIENVHIVGSLKSTSNTNRVSGFADYIGSSVITNCSVSTDITSAYQTAGFVYSASNSCISNSFFNGILDLTDSNGGIFGFAASANSDVEIKNCYSNAVANIPDGEFLGEVSPFVNQVVEYTYDDCIVENCYYNQDKFTLKALGSKIYSSNGSLVRNEIISQGFALTDVQMKSANSFAGFDFVNVWGINENVNGGYPYIKNSNNNYCDTHTYGEWTIISNATCDVDGLRRRVCSVCGSVERENIAALGHDYSEEWTVDAESTCTSTGSKSRHCTKCSSTTDITVIDALGHAFGEWSVRTQPTCTENGEEYRECTRGTCDYEEVNVIEKQGHDYITEWIVDVEPTCTATGYKSYHCSRCSGKTNETVIMALGHDYSEWKVRTAATCTEDGEKYRECVRDNCTHEETEVIEALGHDYSEEWTIDVEATCTTTGSKSHHCSRCSSKTDVTVIDALDHNYTEWTERISPTCTTDGEEYRECTRTNCYHEETSILAARGHDFAEEWTTDVEPTCTTEGSKSHHCSRCSEKSDVTVIEAHGHNYGEWVTKNAATCTTDGEEYRVCTRCPSEETNVLPARGHDFAEEWTTDVEPTCTTEGSKSHHCSRCSEKSDVTAIDALGHDYNEWQTRTAPTCTTDGLEFHTCQRTGCDHEETNVLPARGHDFAEEWTTDVEPTCTTEGSKSHHCSRCSEKSDVTAIDALGHDYNEWQTRTAPTCTTDGLEFHTCQRTGCDHEETNVLPARGHDFAEEWTTDVEPTCTTEGSKSHHCSRCSEKSDVTAIDALGHDYDEWQTRTEATCTTDGLEFHTCQRTGCDHEETNVLPARGHDFAEEWTTDVEPTCTTEGSKSHHCSRCSEKSDVTAIDALGHDYNEWQTRTTPTCTTDGLEFHTCQRTGCDHEETNVLPARGHDFAEEWTTDVEPTCTTEGSKSHHCSRCSEKSDVTAIDALGHDYDEWQTRTEATCTTDGLEFHTCQRTGCSHEETNILPARGHDFAEEWTTDVEPTCTTEGSKSHHCSRCSEKSDVTVIEANGHKFADWITEREPSVLAEGLKTRECSICHTKEEEITDKLFVDPNNQNYGIATFTVVDAQSLAPIENAQIFITTENDGENTFTTDAEGRVTQVLPVGKLNISVYGEDYLARNLKVNIKPGEQIVPNIGLSTRPMVKGELTHELMTMDEIIEAGIDINAPGNQQVYKYSIELDFHAGVDVVSILAYFNGFGNFVGFGGFGGGNGGGGSGSGSGGTGEPTYNLHYHVDDGWHGHGWCKTVKTELGAYEVLSYRPFRDNDDYVFDGWYTDTTYTQRIYNVTVDEYTEMVYGRWIYVGEGEESKSKPFWKTTLSDETPVTIYPVSEKFYMIIYGEVKWLKEMFDVELLVMNDSATDTVENGVAELNLPDGLSLATMRSDVGQQTTVKEIPFIDKMSSESVHWYVRGDKEGSYDLSATFKGVMMPFEEEFTYEFGTERPLQVYAGSAMHMDITVPDSTFYGDDYVIEIALTNVSDRTLYGVRHAITGFEQAKVTEYSDGTVKKTTYVDKGYMGSIGADEFHPGDKMVIEITTNVMFESEVMEYQLGKLTGAIDDIEKLMEAYKAFKKGADLLTSTHSFFKSVSKNIDSVVKDAFIDDIDKAKAVADLLNAVEKFTGSIEKGSSGKALKMVNKVRGTDTYKDLYSVAYDADFYNTHSAGTIANIASNLMAIYNSAEKESVEEEFNAYETIKSLIEAIPIRFYLDNVIVTTLEGSTTEIPYSIHKTPVGARYFGVDNVGKLLWNSGVALMGEVDVPWPLKLLGLDDPTGSKEAEKYVQTVLNETKKFAAKDATGDTSFRAWIIPANQTVSLMSNDAQLFSTQSELFELSSTNENAIYENGVLSFTGPGYINVKPLSSTGGTLYVQMNEDTIQEFILGVVEQHTCSSDKWVALIEPDDETEGTRVKYCDTCNDVIAIESFKICEHHIYGSYVVEVEATETTAGLKSRICTECGHIQYAIINSANDETSLKLNDDSSLEIDEDSGYLINTPEKITVEQLKSNFENQNIIIRNANGDVLSDTSTVGTGYVVQLVVDDEVIDETTVVVKGDISGDGKINVLDMVQLFNFVQGTSTLEGAYKEAAYISNDATINVLDLVTLFNVVQN